MRGSEGERNRGIRGVRGTGGSEGEGNSGIRGASEDQRGEGNR